MGLSFYALPLQSWFVTLLLGFQLSTVPDDIVEQILITLSVKDVLRFKSVCKSCQSFISGSRFIKSHLNHSYINDRRNNNELGHRIIIMCKLPGPNGCLTYYNNYCRLLGSSNGLIGLLTLAAGLYVANPFTREVRKLN